MKAPDIKDPATPEGEEQARAAAFVLIEMARRRWPYWAVAVEAIDDLLAMIVAAIVGGRTVPYANTGTKRGTLVGEAARAGSMLDQVFALEAEDRYRQHLHVDGVCSARAGELRFRAKPGTTNAYSPRTMDVRCPVHQTRPGEPCPGAWRTWEES